jgi:hypothetical protein
MCFYYIDLWIKRRAIARLYPEYNTIITFSNKKMPSNPEGIFKYKILRKLKVNCFS